MEYTEDVYAHNETKMLCRIVNPDIKIQTTFEVIDGCVVACINGDKVAMPKELFEANYSLHEPGERIF